MRIALPVRGRCYSRVKVKPPATCSWPRSPASAAAPSLTPSDLAWRVIGLLSLYRLLVPLLLLAMQSLAGPAWGLVASRPKLFVAACIAYFTAAVLLVIARRLKWSSLRIVALVNASVDAIAVGLILYASGGVASGLGILLVLPVFALTVLADRRDALLIAAVAALGVLAQQLFTGLAGATPAADYTTAGFVGALVFVVALATWPVANRLRESEALVRRQVIDLASIAHEIRNPVGAMSHAGQLLAESPRLTEEERRLTQIIRTNADRVSGIIDNVQRLSRRERARLELLSLPAWIEEFHAEFCETMQWPRARLMVSGTPSDVEVSVDPDQLRQIVWNLCDNALKHAAQGDLGQSIEIRYGRKSPTTRPFLEVADRGPGVAAEHMERIFEPFYSGGRGTGLGLFLARELAQANGATLLYEPRGGGGSVFRLVFADPRRWES